MTSEPAIGAGDIAVRPARLEDHAGIASLFAAADWPVPSQRRWRWLFEENPALRETEPDAPIGWVLEGPSGIGGYLGNIACRCSFGDRELTAMVAHALFVLPQWRAGALQLPAAFFGQKSVPLLLTNTANPTSAAIYRAFKANHLPDGAYAKPLLWLANPGRAVAALLHRRASLPPMLYEAATLPMNALGRLVLGIMRRGPGRPDGPEPALSVMSVAEAGAEFDALWQRVRAAEQRLLSFRDAATLRWHFGDPDRRYPGALIACRVQGHLRGYLVLVPEYAAEARFTKAVVADLMTDPEADRTVLDWLLWAAHSQARRLGFDAVELRGFPPSVRTRFAERRAFMRPIPTMPYLYKANSGPLARALAAPDAWFACPYDGDATLAEPLASAPPGNPKWFVQGLVAGAAPGRDRSVGA